MQVWQTSNLLPLRLGEEKRNKEEQKTGWKYIWSALLHRVTVNKWRAWKVTVEAVCACTCDSKSTGPVCDRQPSIVRWTDRLNGRLTAWEAHQSDMCLLPSQSAAQAQNCQGRTRSLSYNCGYFWLTRRIVHSVNLQTHCKPECCLRSRSIAWLSMSATLLIYSFMFKSAFTMLKILFWRKTSVLSQFVSLMNLDPFCPRTNTWHRWVTFCCCAQVV